MKSAGGLHRKGDDRANPPPIRASPSAMTGAPTLSSTIVGIAAAVAFGVYH